MSLTPEQIEQRRSLVTASDVAAIVGLSPYRTAADVWADKVHGSSFRGNYRTERGHALEPLLCRWLAEKLAPTHLVAPSSETLVHRIHTWLGATPDARIALAGSGDSPVAIGECKTADVNVLDHWRDEAGEWQVPDYYLPQLQIEMTVTGVRWAHVAADLPGEREPVHLIVESDPDLEIALIQACEHFHRRYLSTKTAPPLGRATYQEVANVFRRPTREGMLEATAETERLAAEYLAAQAAKKEAEQQAEIAKAKLCALIADAPGIKGDGWRVLWDERPEAPVPAYTRKAYRHFDLRLVGNAAKQAKKGKAA